MKKLLFWQRFAVALGLLAMFGIAYAADTNGRIKGTASDPSGAVVAGVKISATNTATGVVFQTVTGSDGVYLFPQLPVGTYSVSAAASGFKKFDASGIVINIDQQYVQDLHLVVGSTSDVVQVNASAVQVDTSEMQLSNVINSQQMEELPLIGRNFTGLELTLPGVQASSDRFGSYSVSGAQTQQSSFLINGADTNDIALNTLVIAPNLDAIDQFNLIEGPLNAEYDRNSGGIVSATIKAGTNHFHGDAFEFYRDTFLNTANFYQHSLAGVPHVTKYHQNIPGGTIGGPILKDKLFFFGAYQATRQITPQTGGNVGVPSSAELGGDFSADAGPAGTAPGPTDSWGAFTATPIPSTISIPGCAGDTWAQCAYANGGKFPTSAFNSIAKNLTKYIPGANSGAYGYIFSPVTPNKTDQYIGRIDFALNPQNQIYGLYIDHRVNFSDTLPFTGATVPGFGDTNTENIQQGTFDYVRQFGPTLVNDLAAHYTRFNYDAVEPQTPMAPSSVGFAITPENKNGEGLPTISVSGLNGVGFTLGFSTNGPQPRIDQALQLDDSVSKVIGAHALKFGYEGERFNVSNPFAARNNGSFGFDNTGSPFTSGDGALDFFLGVPDTYSQGSGATIQADAFLNYFFGQDTWKLSDSFTLDYGLAYSIDTPLRNHQYGGEGIACFNNGFNSKLFPGAPTDIAYPGEGGCHNSGQATTRYSEFGPRVGFAWSPSGSNWISGGQHKFAVRGGFGIYYNRTEEESSLQTLETPPFGLNSSGDVDYAVNDATVTGPSFANPYVDINTGTVYNNKFPYAFPHKGQVIDAATWAATEPLDISTYGPSFRAPYAENFQLGIERQLPSNIVARISYVGSLARHNQVTYESDAETAAGHAECLTDPVCQANRNYQPLYNPENTIGNNPEIASVGTVGSFGSSSYHSLQAFVQKGATHGLLFQAAYTYAHALDNASSFENAGFGSSGARGYNQFQPGLNYGDSNFDVRNRFVFSPVYIVPKFAGSDFSPKNIALSGWEISGILTLAQGFPYDVSYAGGTSRSLWCSAGVNFYACPDVPMQSGAVSVGDPRVRSAGTGYSKWITNPGIFTAEPLGSFGNVHRDPYHGPGINNTNMILAKNFIINSERGISLQLRMESDNVFNHTQFSNPTSTFGSSTFGLISGAAAGRQSQLATKIYF